MDKDNSARIEDILKEIRELKEQHEKRADTGEFFNVFLIDGVKIDEDRHSAILADLLNPNGSHRQGNVFLKHFLNLELLGLADYSDLRWLEDFYVKRKANSKYGEIDILLEKKDYACIIIENKIHDAEDQKGQLNRYYRYAKENFTDEQIKLIYLTRYGGVPSGKSLRGVDGQEALDVGRVIRMSYKSAIVGWLENCLAEVKDATKATPIREVLFQYQEHIKNLTDLPTKEDCSMNNKIVSILADNYDLITELEDSIPKAKEHIQDKFFERLKEKIAEVCDLERWDYIQVVPTAKLPIFELDPPFTMELQVYIEEEGDDKGYLWYGFICDESHLKKYLDLAGEEFETRTDIALIYKWPKYENQYISFSDFGTEQMHYIVEDEDNMVETIAQEIKDAVDKFVKAKEDAGL